MHQRPVFWSKVWAAGLALARFLFSEPALCEGMSVRESEVELL